MLTSSLGYVQQVGGGERDARRPDRGEQAWKVRRRCARACAVAQVGQQQQAITARSQEWTPTAILQNISSSATRHPSSLVPHPSSLIPHDLTGVSSMTPDSRTAHTLLFDPFFIPFSFS